MSQTIYPAPPYAFLGQVHGDSFLAYVQEGAIYRHSPDGPQAIGVTTKIHEDLKADYDSIYATCKEYYTGLVEAGVIEPEPTQEDILRRQAEQLKTQAVQLDEASRLVAESARSQAELAGAIAALRAEIEALRGKGGADEYPAGTHQQDPGALPPVETPDQPGLGDNPGLPKFPQRPAAGDSGSKPERGGSAKRTALPAKRTSGRHA